VTPTLERDIRIRNTPAAGSGRADQVPRQSEHIAGKVVYVVRHLVGSTYVVPPRETEEYEGDPVEVLASLRDAADALDLPDYPDSPEQAQERSDLTRALYLLQAESIAAREDREQ
jgi:hypothetical protein